MPADLKVGSFTWSSGSLGTEVITGVGFQPTLVIILAQDLSTFGAFSEEQNISIGFGTATGSGNNRTCLYASGWHGGTVLPTAEGGIRDNEIATHLNAAGLLNDTFRLMSLDADGFTIDATFGGDNGQLFQYLAIGGAGVSAKIGTATWNTSTGAQAITGVGFQPSVVMMASVVETDGALGWGWSDGALNQGSIAAHFLDVASSPSQSKRYYSVTSALSLLSPTTGSMVGLAAVDSLDSDGFTLDWTTAYGVSGTFAYIALSGVNAHAGVFTQPSSTGTQAVSGLSVTPGAVMLASTGQTAAATVDDSFRFLLGVGQVGANQCAWSGDVHAAANFSARRSMRYASDTSSLLSIVPTGTSTGTIESAASVSYATDDSFTLDWSAADATARQVLYLAFDGDLAPIQGSHVFGVTTRVTASRAAAFGLDGEQNTHSESGVFKVFGKVHATEELRSTNVAKGTGAIAGQQVIVGRNSSGSGAAGCLVLYNKSGTPYYLWVEGGNLRIHTAPPTEDNTTVSHTAGTVVGTQT